MEAVWPAIFEEVLRETGIDFFGSEPVSVGGGCINSSFRVTGKSGDESIFVKLNSAEKRSMFEAEFDALKLMAETGTIRIPKPLLTGVNSGFAFIVMEAISFFSGAPDLKMQREMGRQLAAMHREAVPGKGKYGWHRDNVIGETRQPNEWTDSWQEFFATHRLGFQFELAHRTRDRIFRNADALLARVPGILGGHDPAPALLHGDLWGGNAGFDAEGNPVLYDPASYYGDPETDIAFTKMFGGFGSGFYDAYHEIIPKTEGHEIRQSLYNLYHILNHHNLFGGGYGAQAEAVISRLLRVG